MRQLLTSTLSVCLACSNPTTPKTPQDTTEPIMSKDPKLSVEIQTSSTDYKATWGAAGGIAAPSIPLRLTLSNQSSGAWLCPSGSFVLEVSAERAKKTEKKSFPIQKAGCTIDLNETISETTDVGEFLTSMASYYIKGDVLTVRAVVNFQTTKGFSAINITSKPITISIFVPEG